MSVYSCPGCGAAFQRDAPDRPGYLPPNLEGADGGLVCRRCYRLRHYGRAEGDFQSVPRARRQIARALEPAEAVVVITEIGDFDASLPPAGLLPEDKPVILAVNKIDLLPPKATVGEVVAWARARWQAVGSGPAVQAVVAVSAAKGFGLSRLAGLMQRHGGRHRVVALAGATNVGKSTLMHGFLGANGAAPGPTISRLPGTTLAAIRCYLPALDLTVYDTPGFVPGDRLTDLLCPACAAHLVSERTLASRLFVLLPGQAVVFGGFAAFILSGGEPRSWLTYAGNEVVMHRTRQAKAAELLDTRPPWLLPWICPVCRAGPPWRAEEVELGSGEDLAVAGLGWISLRGGPAAIRAVLPQGVRLIHRPGLFGPRTGSTPGG